MPLLSLNRAFVYSFIFLSRMCFVFKITAYSLSNGTVALVIPNYDSHHALRDVFRAYKSAPDPTFRGCSSRWLAGSSLVDFQYKIMAQAGKKSVKGIFCHFITGKCKK